MIQMVGSLCMGLAAGLLFWATVSMGRAPAPIPKKHLN